MASHNLPPIKTLFTDSFELLKKNFVPLIIFYLLITVITVASLVLMTIGFAILGISFGLSEFFRNGFNFAFAWLGVAGALLILIIVMSIIGAAAQVGSILILYHNKPKQSISKILKEGVKYIIPIFLSGIITTLLIVGGFFLLVIPAFIFSIFLTFTQYAIVIENKGVISGMRRSIGIVSSHFIPVLLRILAIWAVTMIFNFILIGFLDNMDNILAQLVIFVLQILVTLYTITYTLVLFKQLEKINKTSSGSLKLFVIPAIVGWVIASVLAIGVINFIKSIVDQNGSSTDTQQELTPKEIEEIETIFGDEVKLDKSIKQIEEPTPSPTRESTGTF